MIGRCPVLAGALLAIGAMLCPPEAPALGRLFTSAQERLMLERRRHDEPEAPEPVTVEPEPMPEPEPPPAVPRVTLNGVVVRSDGRGTAWVNGRSTATGDLAGQNIGVRPDAIGAGAVRIETPSHLPDVELKPGQSWQPEAGRVEDAYEPAPAAAPPPR